MTELAAAPTEAYASRPTIAGRVWPALLILSLTIGNAALMRSLFSPVQEAAKAALGLSDFQMSLIQGVAASIPVAFLSMPLGRLTDRSSRVRLLGILAATWTIGTLATAFADGFLSLFLSRMLAGLGFILAIPVAISITADLCLPERRGRSLLIVSVGQYVGVGAAFALGGLIFGKLSTHGLTFLPGMDAWRQIHIVFGIVAALLALPLLLLREPARHEVGNAVELRAAARFLWARKGFLLPLFIGQVGVVMADVAGTLWAAPVLVRSYHQQPAQFAGWMGLIMLSVGIVGAILGGLAADFGQKAKWRGGVLVGAIIGSAISIPASLFPIMPGVGGFAAMLTVLLTAGAAAGLVTATALAVLIPNEMRGVCLGVFVVIASIIGFGIAPTLVTLGSTLLGGESHLGVSLAITGAAISAISFGAFSLAAIRAGDPRHLPPVPHDN